LADYALAEQSRLTRIVDQMDAKGLVKRKPGLDDRRKVTVHLTAKGKTLAKVLVEKARKHEQSVLDLLDDTDAAVLKPALQTLLAKLASAH